jgi:hypothetical protein
MKKLLPTTIKIVTSIPKLHNPHSTAKKKLNNDYIMLFIKIIDY